MHDVAFDCRFSKLLPVILGIGGGDGQTISISPTSYFPCPSRQKKSSDLFVKLRSDLYVYLGHSYTLPIFCFDFLGDQ